MSAREALPDTDAVSVGGRTLTQATLLLPERTNLRGAFSRSDGQRHATS